MGPVPRFPREIEEGIDNYIALTATRAAAGGAGAVPSSQAAAR